MNIRKSIGPRTVVRPNHAVEGKHQICTPARAHVPQNIDTKMCTSHYVADLNTCAKNSYSHSTPLSSTNR